MKNAKKFLEDVSFHSKDLGVEVVTLTNAITALEMITVEDLEGKDPTVSSELGKLKVVVQAMFDQLKNINK